jgi:hypothetical protein
MSHLTPRGLFKIGGCTTWPFYYPCLSGLVLRRERHCHTDALCCPMAQRDVLWPTCFGSLHLSPMSNSWVNGFRTSEHVFDDVWHWKRREMVILSLFKITSTHQAESLQCHWLGSCISLKNIPVQSFPLWVACLLPPSEEDWVHLLWKMLPLHYLDHEM